jgi:predicted Fe-S protein YdhL (DUF1289 family)
MGLLKWPWWDRRGGVMFQAWFSMASRAKSAGMHKPIASPCIRICAVNPKTGFCDGCFRSLPEIAKWSRFSDEERDTITADLPVRGEKVAALRAEGQA